MFFHNKALIQPVSVGKPDAKFGTYLLEQFGGATGELTAALQYWYSPFTLRMQPSATCFRISPLRNSAISKWSGN
jgi:Mn-containing catalase